MVSRKITTITLAVCVILLFSSIGLYMLWSNERKERHNTEIELSVVRDGVKKYIDKNGNPYYRIPQYQKQISDLKKSSDSIERKMLENAKLNKLKDNQIKSLQYALIEAQASIGSVIIDTLIVEKNVAYDRYAYFDNGALVADIYLKKDSNNALLKYKYTTEVYMTTSWTKRKFFLWRWLGIHGKDQQFDFRCSDTNANIKVLRSISTGK